VSVLRALATIVFLLAAACGPPPDFTVRGTDGYVETDASFAARADLPSRIESTIDTALWYWGGDWSDLRGASITLVGEQYVPCGGNASSLGCYENGEIRVSTRDPGIGTFHCVEQTVLVHEVGHAVIGDPLHTDPRWMLLEPVAHLLAGRTGYTDSGEVECTIWISVWRHPIGTP
jgi:hypothetical protein